MGKTIRVRAAVVAANKGLSPEEVERRLRGKIARRKEMKDKREAVRLALKEENNADID